jgi:hypothetical protein
MTKRLTAIFVLLACIATVGCSKRDDEINAVMKDLDSFTTEMVGKLSAAKDPSLGLAEAQKYFDAKKADIKKKFDAIKDVRGFQISEEIKKKWKTALRKTLPASPRCKSPT